MTEPPRPPGDDPTEPYQQPPTGGYPPPPPPHTPPPPFGTPPSGYPPPPPYGYNPQADLAQDRLWILVAHFGGAAGAFFGAGTLGWIGPLIAYATRGTQSPVVRAEAAKALNFHLLWAVIALVGYILTCIVIGIFVVFAATAVATVIGVIAGVKAANDQPYNYPMSVQFIKR